MRMLCVLCILYHLNNKRRNNMPKFLTEDEVRDNDKKILGFVDTPHDFSRVECQSFLKSLKSPLFCYFQAVGF